jgi:hypothetical protein
MDIVPFSSTQHQAIERMNAKLADAGSRWRFPAKDRPRDADRLPVWEESFVVVEGDECYGGYVLKHQRFFLRGTPLEIGDLQLPLSLGEVDSAYSHVSAALLIDLLRRSPRCYSLGLGSEQTQLAKLLAAAGWEHTAVPFYFNVKSANRFARSIRLPSDKSRLQSALRVLGHLRVAGVVLRARRSLRSRSASGSSRRPGGQTREISRFDDSADALFSAHAASYSLVADRHAAALNLLYPEQDDRFIRILVERDGRVIGWALLLDTAMRDDKFFGDLRVGTLVDCFAGPADVPAIVRAADAVLGRRGVDLVISNQHHPAWCKALEGAGYQLGPSNFFFYYSQALAEALSQIPDWERGIHMNRGDGEGPTHL